MIRVLGLTLRNSRSYQDEDAPPVTMSELQKSCQIIVVGSMDLGRSSTVLKLLRMIQTFEIIKKTLQRIGGTSASLSFGMPLTGNPDRTSDRLNERRQSMSSYFDKDHGTLLHGTGWAGAACMSGAGVMDTPDPLTVACATVEADDGSNVIPMKVDTGGNGSAPSSTNRKHQLHMEVDDDTGKFIDRLVDKAEVKRKSELVRVALREFEWALFEYDELTIPTGTGPSPSASLDLGSVSKGRAAPGTQPLASKPERFSLVLDQRGMDRVKRLKALTKAKSRDEVVLMALCVYDAVLDDRNELLERGGEAAKIVRVDKRSLKASIAQFVRRSG